jgi:hypothetical protein
VMIFIGDDVLSLNKAVMNSALESVNIQLLNNFILS